MTQTSNYALRLQSSLLQGLRNLAAKEGASVNQLINVAVAEKLSAIGAEEYYSERARRANVETAWAILQKAGGDNPPVAGDAWPNDGC